MKFSGRVHATGEDEEGFASPGEVIYETEADFSNDVADAIARWVFDQNDRLFDRIVWVQIEKGSTIWWSNIDFDGIGITRFRDFDDARYWIFGTDAAVMETSDLFRVIRTCFSEIERRMEVTDNLPRYDPNASVPIPKRRMETFPFVSQTEDYSRAEKWLVVVGRFQVDPKHEVRILRPIRPDDGTPPTPKEMTNASFGLRSPTWQVARYVDGNWIV